MNGTFYLQNKLPTIILADRSAFRGEAVNGEYLVVCHLGIFRSR